jgi:threonine aldolase
MKTIDLRSDTVTRPTPAMRAAIAAADVGDDVFSDDPSVNALQDKIAAMLGYEAALFAPTGTQSNLLGLMSHCERGDEYIVGQQAHTYRMEGGGAAVLASIQPQPLTNLPDGTIALDEIAANIKPDDAHFARSRLLTLENTTGGKVLPQVYVRSATNLAHSKGLATHLDGARLFNAAVAQVVSARELCIGFDSVSVCFSKGLGAPVGSVLCGSKSLILKAHKWRKMLGGGMRQAGMLAAGAHYALDHHIERLTQDHANASALAAGLNTVAGLQASANTNIVFINVEHGMTDGLVAHLKAHGVLCTGREAGTYGGKGLLRMVTHLDVNASDIDAAIAVVKSYQPV